MFVYLPKNRQFLLLVLISVLVILGFLNVNYYMFKEYGVRHANSTEMEFRMADRREFFEDMCKGYKLNIAGEDLLHKPNPKEFLINEKHHLIWCHVFKAASTSWLYNFNLLAGYTREFLDETKQDQLHFIKEKYPNPTVEKLKKELETSTSFIIVRHPFERLLAVYRDKICRSTTLNYYRKMVEKIIVEYSHIPQENITRDMLPTFSEFIEYTIDLFHNRNPKQSLDEHWTPIAEFCTPCQFHFDYILKFETLDDDQDYLIKQMNLTSILQTEWKNKLFDTPTADLVAKEFSTLTKSQMIKLYTIYEFDFQLFGYSLDEYLQYAKEN